MPKSNASRSYPRPNSDIKPDRLHLAIVEAAEKGIDWEHVEALVSTLGEKGLIDPAAPWDEHGRPMLGALLECRRSGYDAPLPESLLDLALKLDPQALERKDPGNNTPVDLFLDDMDQDSKNTRRWQSARWWLSHAPRELILGWTPPDRYGDARTPEPNGYYLIKTMLEAERELNCPEHSLLVDLAQLGVDLNARNKDGTSPLTNIKHTAQWELFLENGGDPKQDIESGAETGKLPLWRYLVDHSHDGASQAAEKWARVNVGDTMKQKLYDDYWAHLRQRSDYSTSPGDIPSTVRKHEDYLTLRDPEGRTVAMYVIRMHASAYKTLQQKQYQAMNKERDAGGYSLWHYALAKGKVFTNDVMRFLLDSGAPLDPNPQTGRGLIPSLMIDFPHPHSSYDRYPRNAESIRKLLKKTTGEQWWAMQEGDWEKMKPELEKALEMRDAGPTISYIACEFIDAIPDQAMRDRLIEANLSAYGRGVNAEGVRKYFECGFGDHWPQDKVEGLRHKVGSETYGEIKAIHEARQMDRTVAQVPTPRKGPRL